ncbi:hypothetical protein NPIL_604101, partial [Nephila pilipes]
LTLGCVVAPFPVFAADSDSAADHTESRIARVTGYAGQVGSSVDVLHLSS